jgi:hypothetical protein
LNEGPAVAPFQRAGSSLGDEKRLCDFYYWNTYDYGLGEGFTYSGPINTVYNSAAGQLVHSMSWPAMRTTPTTTAFNPNSGASGTWRDNGGIDFNIAVANSTGTGTGFFASTGSGTLVNGRIVNGHASFNAEV